MSLSPGLLFFLFARPRPARRWPLSSLCRRFSPRFGSSFPPRHSIASPPSPSNLKSGDLNQRAQHLVGWLARLHRMRRSSAPAPAPSSPRRICSPVDTAHNTALSIAVGGGLCALFLAVAILVAACGALRIAQRADLCAWRWRLRFSSGPLLSLLPLWRRAAPPGCCWRLIAVAGAAGREDPARARCLLLRVQPLPDVERLKRTFATLWRCNTSCYIVKSDQVLPASGT